MALNEGTKGTLAKAVEKCIGVVFQDNALIEQAFTHSSSRNGTDYQRLEFVGDRVLGLVIAEMLYESFPEANEGELSLRLNSLVNAETLSKVTEKLKLDELILTGSDVKSLAARKQVNMRADVMEALIAVIYFQEGLEGARSFIVTHWSKLAHSQGVARADAKTALQEWSHQVSGVPPLYTIINRSGPDHDPVFLVEVSVKGYVPDQGNGRSKREAEQAAAYALLTREGVWGNSDNGK